ncbi:MAG: hypothetical protein JSU86_10990, partial [Phycisphaerales bacterium]
MKREPRCRAHVAFFAAVALTNGAVNAQEAVVFRHVNVVPMTQEIVLSDCDVAVRDARIAEIGPSGKIPVPEGVRVVEGMGAFLMPGLADMHIHLDDGWPVDQLHLYLANGVTTIRDMHGSKYMRPFRREVETGKRAGPTLCGTAPVIWGWEDVPSLLAVEHHKAGYDT